MTVGGLMAAASGTKGRSFPYSLPVATRSVAGASNSRKVPAISDLLVRLLGWRALILHGDPCVTDRWLWLRRRLRGPGARTLDAGAGNGGFAIYAARLGNDTLGLSFAPREVASAQRRAAALGVERVHFQVADLRQLDQFAGELGQFDQIICLEVAEHIADDTKLISDLGRLLRPGGRLLLTTPNFEHRALWSESLSQTEDGGHVRWGYSHDEMARLFAAAGLRVVDQGYVSGFVSQRLTNLMRRLQRVSFIVGWALVAPLRVLQVLDGPVTRVLRWPPLCITVVGELEERHTNS
jgi:2-polyprenyl-3-methyl-5-hydroxy-6-metoxy-1,4-benzoquinol methylase